MDYLKGILSGLAAIFIGQLVFFCPLLRGSKAIAAAVLPVMLVESILSPRFWIVGVLLFGLFYAASRGGAVLRVLFFWIPTLAISALGFSIIAMYGYLFFTISRHQ
jgi:predicted anti-sigma-YlaC factor YlaD